MKGVSSVSGTEAYVRSEESVSSQTKAPPSNPTAIIVDDHAVVRMGLRWIFDQHPVVTVIGEADNGASAVQKIFDHRPDLVLLDFRLPDMLGSEVLHDVLHINAATKVLILTVERDRYLADRMIEAGAKGFLVKDGPLQELLTAIKTVLAGGTHIARSLLDESQVASRRPYEPMHFNIVKTFTQEERKVFQCIAGGLNHKTAAAKLGIPRQHFEVVIRQLCDKTGALTEPHLVRVVLDRP